MGYRYVWCGYGRSGGFEVGRDVFAFNTREPVIISLIAEICRPTFSLRSGLRTRSSSRWMRRRCRSAGRCMRAWSGATPTPSPWQHRNRAPCRKRINKSDTRTQARPRNTGTEPRAGFDLAVLYPHPGSRPRTTGTEPRAGDARAAIYVRDAADSIPRSAGPWVAGSVQGPVGRGRPPISPGSAITSLSIPFAPELSPPTGWANSGAAASGPACQCNCVMDPSGRRRIASSRL